MKDFLLIFVLVLIGTLGLGALWSILHLLSGGLGAYLGIGVAAALVLLLGSYHMKPGLRRALVASVLTLIATAYQSFLFAVGIVAGELGYSLSESLKLVDMEMYFAIIKAHTSQAEIIAYALALIAAFVLGFRINRANPDRKPQPRSLRAK